MTPVIFGGIITALIAAAGAAFAVMRKQSGRIGTSSSEELWKQTQEMYRAQHEMVTDGITRIRRLEVQVDELRRGNEACAKENIRLETVIIALRLEVANQLTKLTNGLG